MFRSNVAWLSRRVGNLATDLTVVLAVLVFANVAMFVPVVNDSFVRPLLGFVFVLFVPGYAFVAALFPAASRDADRKQGGRIYRRRSNGITGIERALLSLGSSAVIVPFVAFVLNFTPFALSLVPVVMVVSAVTLVATGVAAVRREALPADRRFHVTLRSRLGQAKTGLVDDRSQTDLALSVCLVLSVLLAGSSLAYTVATPEHDDAFTELYLLTENESGDLVADDYPQNLTAGTSSTLTVGVENHEYEPQRYTVVTALQRVETSGNEATVVDEQVLGRYQTGVLADNETWRQTHDVTPQLTGEDLRLTYLLYRGDAPPDPSVDSAYRSLHLWVDVAGE